MKYSIFLFRKYCGTYAVYQQKNAAELAEYIQSNILPDYDNFVKAGEQYNNDAVHINDIVGNFNKMSFELRQSILIIKGC